MDDYLVGYDDSPNDPDLNAWVIYTIDTDGLVEHYDALIWDDDVITDPDLDLQDAADMAREQLRSRGVL